MVSHISRKTSEIWGTRRLWQGKRFEKDFYLLRISRAMIKR
jgi:hypothetical protein